MRLGLCLALVASALFVVACQDQNLGDVRPPDASTGSGTTNGTPTCAALGGTCAATGCAVGQGHLSADATSDCNTSATMCCLAESACPTETFSCCGTTGTGNIKTRPLCQVATAAMAEKLVCASGLNPC